MMHVGTNSRERGVLPRHTRRILGSVVRRESVFFVFSLMILVSIMSPIAIGLLGEDENEIDLIVGISATGNAPTIGTLPNPLYVDIGVSKIINVRVNDSDNDILNVTWDWGDGSPLEVNTTAPALVAIRVYNEHTWIPPIEYTQGAGPYNFSYELKIVVDDGQGNYAWRNTTILCYVPENYGPSSDIEGPSTVVAPTDTVTFVARANDTEGEPLTWTFILNDSVTDSVIGVFNTPASDPATWVWNNFTYVFGAEGYFNVTLFVSDAIGDNQTGLHNTSDRATVQSYLNKIPFVTNITVTPQSPIINETGYINVTYKIDVYDQEADVMNATWDFGDGSPVRYNESGALRITYTFYQSVNYTDTGVFNISFVVTDGRPGHEVYRWTTVYVNSTNLPPSVTGFSFNYSQGSFELPNVTLNFTLSITDPELNLVTLTVSWGDGSPYEYYNLTEFVEGNVTLVISHAYGSVGQYMIELWYTDNKSGLLNHSKYYNLTVKVEIPPPIIIKRWSWWDYTSLALFALIPVLVAVRLYYVARQRRLIEAQGMTLEEYRLIQSERARQQEEALEHELAKQMEDTKS